MRIQLSDHSPEWAIVFAAEAERIRAALGGGALLIEHVGSTSVAGLAAKPIVDILLVVSDSSDEASYAPELESAGYELRIREPEFHEHRLFKLSAGDVNLHVLTVGSSEIERYLLFRDRLRANGDDRRRYEEIKRQLAARRWETVDEYASAKSEIVEDIIASARACAIAELRIES